jgi:nucleoside-diphosphate-sugar epimerase
MKTAIVTGANGFIGSHIVHQLLKQKCSVHALGRSTAAAPWPQRMAAALREVDGAADTFRALHCHEFDLCNQDPYWRFLSQCDSTPDDTLLFHVAGDTQFTPRDPEQQRAVNVEASINLVKGLKGRVARAVHVSTAFVAGDRMGLVREDELDCGQHFHNSYEKSKLDAEVALTALCRDHDLPLVIVRPSIIINDRRSGRASTFTHLNALVEVITRIQEHYRITDGQIISKRVRLVVDPEARPNLAPVDSIVPPLLKIAGSAAAAGKTFHLCHPSPGSNASLVDLVCEAFGIRGGIAFEFMDKIAPPLSYTEEMILRSLKPYSPYLNTRCEFALRQSRSLVPEYDSYFTPLDVSYLRKVIHYQREHRR